MFAHFLFCKHWKNFFLTLCDLQSQQGSFHACTAITTITLDLVKIMPTSAVHTVICGIWKNIKEDNSPLKCICSGKRKRERSSFYDFPLRGQFRTHQQAPHQRQWSFDSLQLSSAEHRNQGWLYFWHRAGDHSCNPQRGMNLQISIWWGNKLFQGVIVQW